MSCESGLLHSQRMAATRMAPISDQVKYNSCRMYADSSSEQQWAQAKPTLLPGWSDFHRYDLRASCHCISVLTLCYGRLQYLGPEEVAARQAEAAAAVKAAKLDAVERLLWGHQATSCRTAKSAGEKGPVPDYAGTISQA